MSRWWEKISWLTSPPRNDVTAFPLLKVVHIVISVDWRVLSKHSCIEEAEAALALICDARNTMGVPLEETRVIWEPSNPLTGY
jgi:hypothetical protein